MHIAFDARMPTYRQGGISQYVLQLLPALAAVDAENHYTVLQSRKERRWLGPPVANFRRGRLLTPPHHRWERWALGVELLPRRADVLHSPDFIPPAFGARRRVITVHDLSFLHFPEHLTEESRRYYNDQIGWAVQAADAISADSESTRQDLIAMVGAAPEKVRTIPLAANPLFREPADPAAVAATLARLGLAPGYLLFVGTLEPRKNVPLLLRAYQQVRLESGVTAPLLLVGGKGWLYDEIFATVGELGLREFVRHLSDVDDRTLQHLYHGASLLALPSHYEGFGLPALEAMHCGCPVLASERGSLPEVVGKAGVLLPADDVVAWAETIAALLDDDERREKMALAGQVQAAQFSWEQTARGTLALYEEVSR
jgi:glycosyltransferase involved in cell wall biosynthesis